MCVCIFTSNMGLLKLTFLILLLHIGFTEQVVIQCSTSFDTGNDSNLCYYYKNKSFSWSDAYNQCLTRTVDGVLIQIFSIEQFNLLKTANIDETSVFWLGANNFASFSDFQWHWIDGSIVNNSVITWCPNSSYEIAIGTQCAAYDSTLQCVNNYFCDTLLPAPCVSISNGVNIQAKNILISRQATTSTYICASSFGGSYSNWWTYSSLLINWFILMCFFLYLCNRFILNKNIIMLTTSLLILSFILILIFAILWGVQYNDLIQIPLATVIIGSLASACLLISLLIILNNRTRVQRFMASMISVFLTIIVEFFLMLGIILCTAYCSGYITLTSTSLDKDIIASILASLLSAISILFYTGILHLLENAGLDRVHAMPSTNSNVIPLTTPQVIAPPRQSNTTAPSINNRLTAIVPIKKHEHIDRATSPVDERILNEFYSDLPKDVHQYRLEGRQYVVYEGVNLSDIESYRKELTQAMLIQESEGLREAIDHAKHSIHASTLADEIKQAQNLATKLV